MVRAYVILSLLLLFAGTTNMVVAADCPQAIIKKIIANETAPALLLQSGKRWPLAGLVMPSTDRIFDSAQMDNYRGMPVRQACKKSILNRYGAPAGMIHLGGEQLLQLEMLQQGRALVAPILPADANPSDFFNAEDAARTSAKGIWHKADFMLDAGALAAVPGAERGTVRGAYFIVRGTPRSARKVERTFYLNFGANYRTDFTLEASGTALRHLKKRWPDPGLLVGRAVEVRGFVDFKNGPRIILRDVRTLRLLDEENQAQVPGAY